MEQAEQDAIDARRWRAVCMRHGVAMTRMATGSSSYSSHKKQAILDAWADMAAAEVEGFDPDAYRAEVEERIAEFERNEQTHNAGSNGPSGVAAKVRVD